MTHTPGPWHIGEHGGTSNAYIWIWPADENKRGCVARVNLYDADGQRPQREANASLISAAPDMLAALHLIMAALERHHARLGWPQGMDGAAVYAASAAIAKATNAEREGRGHITHVTLP